MRFFLKSLTIIAIALVGMTGCKRQATPPVPAEVQFVRDEATRFQQYTDLVNRQKEDAAATQSFIKLWGDAVCKKRDQQLIAFGDRVGCGTLPSAAPPVAPLPKEKK
jgi:hypothetical protein